MKSRSQAPKPPLPPKPDFKKHSALTNKLSKPELDLSKIGGNEVNDNIDEFYPHKSTTNAKSNDLNVLTDNSNNNNNTFIVHDNQESQEPILRTKNPPRVQKTDEEVYAELRSICNLSNPLDKYKKKKEVGKGASGVVFIALNLENDREVAIKTIDLRNQSSKELILNEIRVLKDFNHKNLVNFLDAYYLEEEDNLWVVLEYMNG